MDGAALAFTPSITSGRLAVTIGGQPKITSGAFASGPPGSPSDGDIWIATSVNGTTGVVWQFRYNAGSASAYKWEFIGGPPASAQDATRTHRQVGSNNAWLAVPGIGTIVTARAGDYYYTESCWIGGSLNSQTFGGTGNSGSAADPSIQYTSGSATNNIPAASQGVVTGQSSNFTWGFYMFTSDFTTCYVADTSFSVLPIRVS